MDCDAILLDRTRLPSGRAGLFTKDFHICDWWIFRPVCSLANTQSIKLSSLEESTIPCQC